MTIPSRLRPAVLGLALAGLLLASAAPLGAKNDPTKPYALIFGTVWGPEDRPVAGVRVKIRRADKKRAQWILYSDRRGEFAQRVPAGAAEYVVWADIKTAKGEEAPQVRVPIENDERRDIGLHLKSSNPK